MALPDWSNTQNEKITKLDEALGKISNSCSFSLEQQHELTDVFIALYEALKGTK